MAQEIYLDHLATTPVDPRVLQAMLPYFSENFGNAASLSHRYGLRASAAVEHARERIAGLIGALPEEIYFTSGATEANNLAILGVAESHGAAKNHLITSCVEHRAVLDPCGYLEKQGYALTYLPVDSEGLLDPRGVERAITPKTLLVSVMAANNEIGTLQPVAEIADICARRGVFFHTDAAQALGKIPLSLKEISADLVSASAHKVYGPKGVGFLYRRRRRPKLALAPRFYGGGHESGLRSGTLNVPGIVGFAEALRIAEQEREGESIRIAALRDRLYRGIAAQIPELRRNGSAARALPQCLNLSFAGVTSEALLMELRDIALSSGSACSTGTPRPSHVLEALGVSEEYRRGAVRFGLGRGTTEEEIDEVVRQVVQAVKKLREP